MSALRQLEKRHSEWKSYFEQFRETVNTCPLVNADSPVLARLYELEQKGLINQNAVSQKIAEPS
ncbi:hypothetical protein ACQP3L_35265, partial [Escherichia coli]